MEHVLSGSGTYPSPACPLVMVWAFISPVLWITPLWFFSPPSFTCPGQNWVTSGPSPVSVFEGRDGADPPRQTCPPSQKSRRSERNDRSEKRLFRLHQTIRPSLIHHWNLWAILPEDFVLRFRLRFESLLHREPAAYEATSIFSLKQPKTPAFMKDLSCAPFLKSWNYDQSVPLWTPLEMYGCSYLRRNALLVPIQFSSDGKKQECTLCNMWININAYRYQTFCYIRIVMLMYNSLSMNVFHQQAE